jgi:aspartyl protease
MLRYVSVLIVLAILASPASVLAQTASPLNPLLAKHTAFVGWQFGDIPSIKLAGTVGKSDFTIVRRGALFRVSRRNRQSTLTDGFGFTGKTFWYANYNSFVSRVLGEATREQISAQYIYNEGFAGLPATDQGTHSLNGAVLHVLRVSPGSNAFPIDLYLDENTGDLKRAVIDPSDRQTTIDIQGYTTVGGKKIISKWSVDGGASYVATSVQVGVPVSDNDIRPPYPTAKWTYGAGAPIQVDLSRNSVLFDATVNGVKGRFILDSGASSIVLKSSFADRVGLKSVGSVAVGCAGKTGTNQVGKISTITIGDNTLHNVYVDSGLSESATEDGLIGYDFLANAVVNVDLEQSKMTVFDPSVMQAQAAAGSAVIVPDLSNGIPTIPVTFNGGTKANVAVDTGDGGSVVVSDALNTPGKISFRPEGYTHFEGACGQAPDPSPCGHTNSIEMGPIVYQNVPICFDVSWTSGNGGVIGFDFLQHFNWTFDYWHGVVLLTPNKRTPARL